MMSHKHMATNFPWIDLGSATVVDLGGSHGELCVALALAAPNLKLIVQELPRTVQSVNQDAIPSAVASRVEFMEHDFFKPQPVCDTHLPNLLHLTHMCQNFQSMLSVVEVFSISLSYIQYS